jgi:hypothetical protein
MNDAEHLVVRADAEDEGEAVVFDEGEAEGVLVEGAGGGFVVRSDGADVQG